MAIIFLCAVRLFLCLLPSLLSFKFVSFLVPSCLMGPAQTFFFSQELFFTAALHSKRSWDASTNCTLRKVSRTSRNTNKEGRRSFLCFAYIYRCHTLARVCVQLCSCRAVSVLVFKNTCLFACVPLVINFIYNSSLRFLFCCCYCC